MIVIPAIDLYGGRCVRLFRGDFSKKTDYADDPVWRAKFFADCGARWLHVVDLDAAEGRGADNRGVIARIRAAVDCRVECGGGVRTMEDARALRDIGIDKIVIGTALMRAPAEVARWISGLGGDFAGGIDAYDGRVKIAGWLKDADCDDAAAAGGLSALGFRGMIYTNISRDATMAGPDVERTVRAARAAGLPTIVSGGIGAAEHLRAVHECGESLISGVIVGKAFYEGKIDPADALRSFRRDPELPW